jgi:AraC-like DNA-binding protein
MIKEVHIMDCKLELVYSVIREKSEYISLHKHECYELVYYINGSGCSKIGNESYSYSSNNFAIIEPNYYHDESHYNTTNVIFIGFKYNGNAISLKTGIYTDNHQQSVLNYLNEIKKEISEHKKHFQWKVDLLLQELLIEFSRLDVQRVSKNCDFSYIKKFIEENYNHKIDIKSLSELSGYSYHHFRHTFKQKTGFSPINYLMHQRILNAQILLKQSTLTMIDICTECGFSNESQFSSMFRKMTGLTPSMYRKSTTMDIYVHAFKSADTTASNLLEKALL